jgi:hypothetical protein
MKYIDIHFLLSHTSLTRKDINFHKNKVSFRRSGVTEKSILIEEEMNDPYTSHDYL